MRIYTSSNSPLDYCAGCAPADNEATRALHQDGLGPDGRGDCYAHDAEHPSYEDDEAYRCHTCKRKLNDTRD